MTLYLLLGLALAQDPEAPETTAPPTSSTTSSTTVGVAEKKPAKPANPGALLLTDEDRVALTAILVPLADLRGEERRDALLVPMADPDVSPAIKAALARALGQAFEDDTPHNRLVASAMRDREPDRAEAEPEKPPIALTSAKLGSVRAYQRQRLVVRQETELRGGGQSVVSSPWANPYSMTQNQVVQDPIYAVQGWGIYQGSRRLTVPEYLGVIGSDDMKAFLDQDIVRLQATSKGLYAFGGLGVAATVVGIVGGMNNSLPREQRLIFFTAAGGGVVAMLTGLIGGSVPAAKATQIKNDPEYTFTPEQVQDGVDTYNETLRSDLGLSSEEVLLIEAAGAGAQVQPYIVPSGGRGGVGLQLGVGGSF